MDKKVVKRSIFSYIFLFIIVLGIFYFINMSDSKINKLTYNEFLQQLSENRVTELHINPNGNQGIYQISGKLKGYKEKEKFITSATLSEQTIKEINELNDNNKIKVVVSKDPGSSWILVLIINLLPIV